MSIYTKLLELQKHCKGLGKDKRSFNYEYVTGNKVLSVIRPKMDELGIILKQEVVSIDNERMDYQQFDRKTNQFTTKSEILTKVNIRFTWVDCETGEKDENLFAANGMNDWEKGLGSALTYAERYFLLKYFHIATDEDDIDNPDRQGKQQAQQPVNPPVDNRKPLSLSSLKGDVANKFFDWIEKAEAEAVNNKERFSIHGFVQKSYIVSADEMNEIVKLYNAHKALNKK